MLKKMLISFAAGFFIGVAVCGIFVHGNYSELESRYNALEATNNKLRESNTELIANNQRLADEQRSSAELINEGRGIIAEFESGLGDSSDTIDRIESGINALERIIDLLLKDEQG